MKYKTFTSTYKMVKLLLYVSMFSE